MPWLERTLMHTSGIPCLACMRELVRTKCYRMIAVPDAREFAGHVPFAVCKIAYYAALARIFV